MKKCKNCFLSPDMCGAINDEKKCDSIYENKWSMRWDTFKEWTILVIGGVFLILVAIAMYWYYTKR